MKEDKDLKHYLKKRAKGVRVKNKDFRVYSYLVIYSKLGDYLSHEKSP